MPAPKKWTSKGRKGRRAGAKMPCRGLGRFPGRPVSVLAPTYTYDFHLLPQTVTMIAGSGPPTPTGPVPQLYGANSPIVASTDLVASGFANGLPNTADVGIGCYHSLRDCQQYLAYTALYDAFRIDEISVTLEWLPNVGANSTGSFVAPTFWFYPDQDDSSPPTTTGQIMGKQGLRRFVPGSSTRAVTYKFKPKLGHIVQATPIGTGLAPAPVTAGWLNCNNPDAAHFASKIFLQDMTGPDVTVNPNLLNSVRIQYSYRISFRSPIKAN